MSDSDDVTIIESQLNLQDELDEIQNVTDIEGCMLLRASDNSIVLSNIPIELQNDILWEIVVLRDTFQQFSTGIKNGELLELLLEGELGFIFMYNLPPNYILISFGPKEINLAYMKMGMFDIISRMKEKISQEELRLKAIEEARLKAKEEARLRAEEEAARIKAEEEARIKAEIEATRKKAAEEARKKAEEEARRKAEEEARRKAAEEARIKAETETRLRAEAEAKRRAEELMKAELARIAQATLETEARKKAEQEARLRAEAEATRLRAEAEARAKAEEAVRIKAEEAARVKAEEEARRKAEEEVRIKAEEAKRMKDEEAARIKAEEEARRKAAEEIKIKAEKEKALTSETKPALIQLIKDFSRSSNKNSVLKEIFEKFELIISNVNGSELADILDKIKDEVLVGIGGSLVLYDISKNVRDLRKISGILVPKDISALQNSIKNWMERLVKK
jgi:membrane protein involved in colicin uptake/predicted regulator of Ras-like GTPase activity (Roadblock/LC7/MglB family)